VARRPARPAGERGRPGAVTDYQVFLGQAHSLTIDAGWRSVAYYCLDWLTRQGL
jgi:hypothetical protein